MLEKAVFTVSELNTYVSALLNADPYMNQLHVRGEISGFKRASSGHLYFTLKDEQSSVSCVMFKAETFTLNFRPQDGMKVTISGRAALYPRDGRFQVYVNSMVHQGAGELMLQFMELKQRYEALGYFDAAIKKRIPFLPEAVGVVTSETGAVIQDIRNVIGRRFPNMPIYLYPVRVQGDGAEKEIAAGIRYFNIHPMCSVLIVGRGGGSMEDLWGFNRPEVVEAIHQSTLPVISAVGHETDFTLADFAADLRAPTPSAAAELAVPDIADLFQDLEGCHIRLIHSLSHGVLKKRADLQALLTSPGMRRMETILRDQRNTLTLLSERCSRAAGNRIVNERSALEIMNGKLQALSPELVLQRGYAIVTDENGSAVSQVTSIYPGETVRLRFMDGNALAGIQSIEENGNDGR